MPIHAMRLTLLILAFTATVNVIDGHRIKAMVAAQPSKEAPQSDASARLVKSAFKKLIVLTLMTKALGFSGPAGTPPRMGRDVMSTPSTIGHEVMIAAGPNLGKEILSAVGWGVAEVGWNEYRREGNLDRVIEKDLLKTIQLMAGSEVNMDYLMKLMDVSDVAEVRNTLDANHRPQWVKQTAKTMVRNVFGGGLLGLVVKAGGGSVPSDEEEMAAFLKTRRIVLAATQKSIEEVEKNPKTLDDGDFELFADLKQRSEAALLDNDALFADLNRRQEELGMPPLSAKPSTEAFEKEDSGLSIMKFIQDKIDSGEPFENTAAYDMSAFMS